MLNCDVLVLEINSFRHPEKVLRVLGKQVSKGLHEGSDKLAHIIELAESLEKHEIAMF